MDALEIINEYNRNIRQKTFKETWDIYNQRIAEYMAEHKYASEAMFLYPDVLGWDENWLEMMKKQTCSKND